ncbi:MAG: D-alanyl-D-alanine carboxypeptidase [Clostridia bacterium]|nr:D-alanyl-D-alanine carboxypeptidase [Clostridia bacterium]
MKKLVCIILCLAFLSLSAAAVSATDSAPAVTISAPSAVLMHSSGEVLFEKNAHEKRPIASVTKVMTLLLVFEAIECGNLSMADMVTGSAHAASMGGSQIWLEEGEKLSVEDMLKAVTICSANDCAVALGEHISGSEDAFVALMNQRAAQLGMNDTTFKNACGLHEEGHLSSAYDVALMSRELIKYSKVSEYATTWEATLRGGESVLNNTNKMIRSYDGMTGLKTGFTTQAGYCLAATATRENTGLIAVVLGGETSEKRNADIAALLNWGFANYMSVIPTPDMPLMPIPVRLGKEKSVRIKLADAQGVLAQKGVEITKNITLEKEVKAPVKEGDRLGTLTAEQNGKVLCEIPIVAAKRVEKMSFWDIFLKLLKISTMR